MRRVAVVNLKGGTGKSTTAGWLHAACLHLGYRTGSMDCDPSGTLRRWAAVAGWRTYGLSPSQAARVGAEITGLVPPGGLDVLVLDTPPLELQRRIVASALEAATDVVIAIAPTSSEMDGLAPIWELISDTVDTGVPVSVLFNRVRGRSAHAGYRLGLVEDQGRHVLDAWIPTLERYAQSVGEPMAVGSADPYVDAARELAARGGWSR